MWFVLYAFQMFDLNQASMDPLMTIDGVGIESKLYEKKRKRTALKGVKKNTTSAWSNNSVISDAELEELLEGASEVPSVQQVQEKALRYANAHPEQIRSTLSRARKAHWLPKFQAGLDPKMGLSDTLQHKNNEDVFTNRQDHDWNFQFKVEWHFNNLIFNHDEVVLNYNLVRQSLVRERILEQVNEAYFMLKRLQIQKKAGLYESSLAKIEAALKMQELSAELDGLTGGWFSKQ